MEDEVVPPPLFRRGGKEVRLSNDLLLNWKIKCLGFHRSTAPSLSEKEMEDEAVPPPLFRRGGREVRHFQYLSIHVLKYFLIKNKLRL
jgi:hypothetical protein